VLNFIMLSVVMLIVDVLCDVLLSVVVLNFIILSVIMLSVDMLCVSMLSDVLLSRWLC
jgi:hypothetical protein